MKHVAGHGVEQAADLAEEIDERAAIMEHCGGLPREQAEEAARAECEARYVARMATDDQRRDFLAAVERHRGREAAQALRRDAWRIINQRRGVASG